MMRSLTVALIILSVASPLVLAENQESARKVLEIRGIPFTEDGFVSRAVWGDFSAITLMLDAGMSADTKDSVGMPALVAAVSEMGIPKSIPIDSDEGFGAIIITEVRSGLREPRHSAVVLELLNRGANPNASDKRGTTAIMRAARLGYEAITKALLDRGADVNAKNAGGESAMLLATENDHTAIVAMLIENGADVNVKSRDGLSILRTAMDNGRTEIVKLLLQGGAELPVGNFAQSVKRPNTSNSQPPSFEERIKALETAVTILQSENASKKIKITKLEAEVVKLKRKVSPHLELLSGDR